MTSVNDIVIETDKLKIEKIQLDEQGNLTADYSFEDKTYTVKITSDEITQMSSELESKFVQPEEPKGSSGGNKRSQKKIHNRKHKATMKRK